MATRTAAVTNPEQFIAGQSYLRTAWTGLLNGDDGSPQRQVSQADRSVQVKGTFGVGGTVVIEGSNDEGVSYVTLVDQAGAALSFTAAGIKQIRDLPGLIRPRVTAGDGTTSLEVHLIARSNLR